MSIRDAVSAAELERHLAGVTAEVRLSGSPEEGRAFDYIEEQLTQFGYDVQRFQSEALIGYPVRSSLQVLGGLPREIRANGYSLSPSTGPEGITGDLIYVGAGMPADYAGIDARGKIVLSDGLAMPGKARAASLAGAIGQIHANDEQIHEMCLSPVWGTPIPETASLLPDVPAVGVTREDGDRLKTSAASGAVSIQLVTEPYLAWTAIPTLTADLPGSEEDRFVLFSGHVDSWHLGVMDNGTANATQLEVARLLAERRNELRRGVRLAFWSGHSHGRYAGSAWYADAFWHDLHERCVCHVNIDSVGAKGATILDGTSSMASTYPFARSVLKETVGAELRYHRKGRSSDQSFWGHGIPAMFGALSLRPGGGEDAAVAEIFGGESLGWWWHTTEDLIDKIDRDFLVRDARVYAETLWRLCADERLPFDPAAEVDEIASAADNYQNASGGSLDLSSTSELARELSSLIRVAGIDRLPAGRANDVIRAL